MEMVKAKLRLTLVAISLVLIPILLFVINMYFSSKLTYTGVKSDQDFDDHEVAQLRQRRLSQPFAWHQDTETKSKSDNSLSDNSSDELNLDETTQKNSSDQKPSLPTTCRNSVQGKIYIADDRGYMCVRHHVIGSTGCCNITLSTRYDCLECQEQTGCCKMYEQCISCCMNPKNQPALTSVLQEANALSNILLLSVSDHFELCLAKCRTSSKSVQHENLYINPFKKYCFMKGSPITQEPTGESGG